MCARSATELDSVRRTPLPEEAEQEGRKRRRRRRRRRRRCRRRREKIRRPASRINKNVHK